MMWSPGMKVKFKGVMWTVNAVDAATEMVELKRANGSEVNVWNTTAESLYAQTKAEIEGEARDVMAKFIVEQPSAGVDFASEYQALWAKLMGVSSWGVAPVQGGNVEDDMWAKLAPYGISRQSKGAMADMIKNIAAQFEAMAATATPAAEAMRSFGDVLRDHPQMGQLPIEDNFGRKQQMDVKYETPACDGFAVLWRKPGGKPRIGVTISIVGVGEDDWAQLGNYECEQVASLADAWTFVDYLNDEELGSAKAIREDACVLFCNEVGSWEALTNEPLPEAWQ